jgi:hypothetical protein
VAQVAFDEEIMRKIFSFLIATGLLLVPMVTRSGHITNVQSWSRQGRKFVAGCMTQAEVMDSLRQLSTSASTREQQGIVARLRDMASSSAECRKQVVTSLIAALKNANRDLVLDRPSFFLWYYGSKLLADLKAVEALDLLITNFDLHDGTPFPFNHRPALGAIIHIGEAAIPSLNAVLAQSTNDDTRKYVVFCLALIGGKIARNVLQQRLAAESNCCIRNCIEATLNAFRNKTLPNQITSKDRNKWYDAFMCDCDPAMRITIKTTSN